MRTWRWLAVLAVLGLVLAACAGPGTSASSAPSSSAVTPSASAGPPFEATAYPEDGPAKCGADNNPSNISEIKATDEHTVVFTLCTPDVAFLSKVAFSAFAINDTEYLKAHIPDGPIVEKPNGTGPYKLEAWNRGSDVTMSASTATGETRRSRRRSSSSGAPKRPSGWSSSSPAASTGSTIPAR